jgi:hypothetical protein
MCGGVIFPYRKEYAEALAQSFSPEELAEFERTGQVRSLYWQRGQPVLPVLAGDGEGDRSSGLELVRWGNRDKEAPFPQTGWARVDSIEAGKWNHLRPKPVLIPVSYGVEKGKWFPIDQGIKGVLVQRKGEERVYMLTADATPEFLGVTKHERMPILQDQTTFRWLEGDPYPAGTLPATQGNLFTP